jgi:hypothetical protein
MPDHKSSRPDPEAKPSPPCAECERLWRVYTLATRRYIDATLAEEAARQTGDLEKTMKILEDEATEAAEFRDFARKAVRNHAATHAGEKPAKH